MMLARRTARGVADVIVAVVTEGHVDHAAPPETLYLRKISPDGISVLYSPHHSPAAFAFQTVQVCWRISQTDALTTGNHCFNFGQQSVCLLRSGGQMLRRSLALRQIGHHDGGVKSPFGHLVQIDKHLGITVVEVNATIEEHRRVAMAVERQDTTMNVTSAAIESTLVHEATENREHHVISSREETLGMPLHTYGKAEISTLDGFNDTVSRPCRHTKVSSGTDNSLMMKGVDGETPAEEFCQQTALVGLHKMGRDAAVKLLVVLNGQRSLLIMPCGNILADFASHSSHHNLNATAYTQHG